MRKLPVLALIAVTFVVVRTSTPFVKNRNDEPS